MRHRGSWDAEPQWQEDSRHDAPSYYPSGHLPGSNGAHWGGPPPPPGQTAASLPPDSAGLGVPRPPSATFSDVSRGSGEAPPAAPPLPQPNLSPMSDDEDDMPHGNGSAAPAEAGAAVLDVFNGEGSSPEEIPVPGNDPMREGDEREYGPSEDGDTWPEPNKSFDAFVAETVRHRLGKYQQPDHPVRLSADDAQQLYEQIKGEVISKEQHAFRDRQRNGVHKPIERRKLEVRIKDFVRDRVRRWHEKQGVV